MASCEYGKGRLSECYFIHNGKSVMSCSVNFCPYGNLAEIRRTPVCITRGNLREKGLTIIIKNDPPEKILEI